MKFFGFTRSIFISFLSTGTVASNSRVYPSPMMKVKNEKWCKCLSCCTVVPLQGLWKSPRPTADLIRASSPCCRAFGLTSQLALCYFCSSSPSLGQSWRHSYKASALPPPGGLQPGLLQWHSSPVGHSSRDHRSRLFTWPFLDSSRETMGQKKKWAAFYSKKPIFMIGFLQSLSACSNAAAWPPIFMTVFSWP